MDVFDIRWFDGDGSVFYIVEWDSIESDNLINRRVFLPVFDYLNDPFMIRG